MTHNTPIGYIKRFIFSFLALILSLLYPSAVSFAEDAPTNDTSAGQGQVAPIAGQPTGDDATTYHYNSQTGKWENEHYIWDPATRKTTPKDNLPYSYNPATGRWDTTEWRYNSTTGKWEPNTISVAKPPAGSKTVGGPDEIAPTAQSTAPQAYIDTGPASENATQPSLDSAASSTPHSTSSYFDGFYNAAISNTIATDATSGNAVVSGNVRAGNAVSGDAIATTNVFNLLQSTASFANLSNVNTFVTDIDGDVYGDLFIDPAQLGNLQPAHTPNLDATNTQVNIAHGNGIANDILVNARSGDATVYGNNTAGEAKTGNANAVANLVNLINTSIAANQSFIGTLNINGNLNGDLLLPPDVLNTLLASNAPTTAVSLSSADKAALDATLLNDQSITNTIDATATTGNATVTGNNHGGNAATGNASSTITVLNLTGRQIVGDDSLLVFVSVHGKWVGALINAPQGATAAVLGDGITENTGAVTGDINAANDSTITNNVRIAAQSGDAAVGHNMTAGNAATGNATVSANVANVNNSHISLGGWFGMLFINVFGSWIGSFGVDTDAGGKALSNTGNTADNHTTSPASSPTSVHVFRFTSTTTSTNPHVATGVIPAEVDAGIQPGATQPTVLGASTAGSSHPPSKNPTRSDFDFPLGALSLGGRLFAAERALSRRHAKH